MFRKLAAFVAVAAVAALVLPQSAIAGDAAAGKTLYDANCMSCHGPGGKGDGPVGKILQPPPRDFTVGDFKFDANKSGAPGEDEDLVLVTKQGAMAFGGSALMAPWPTLSDEQLANLVAYIRSLKE